VVEASTATFFTAFAFVRRRGAGFRHGAKFPAEFLKAARTCSPMEAAARGHHFRNEQAGEDASFSEYGREW